MSGTVWDDWLAERAALRVERGTVRADPVLRDSGGRARLDLASNDYLGLSRHPRVMAAAKAAIERHGAGATASRLVTGTLPIHRELESALVALTGQPSGLAFSTGYAANLGVLTAMAGRGAEILLDEHAHASLHDAARMSRVPYATFRHNDIDDLDAALETRQGSRVVVAVESIYSVLGDAAPLVALAEVAARHDALLVVDEAHGIGVAGQGRGLVAELGLVGAPNIVVTATLSKSLGAQGGAVLGSPAIRGHLVNTARNFIFDTGLAPAAAGAAAEAARLIAADPTLAARVRSNAASISAKCGIDQSSGAVQSIPMPSPEVAVAACLDLRERGVLVGCFRPPSVPDGISRLRVTARADLSPTDVEQAANLVAEVAAAHRLHTRPKSQSSVHNLRTAPARELHTRPEGGGDMPRVLIITGTDTEVGKTVVTAATAAVLAGAGLSPAAYKPVQTGVTPGEPGDMGEVERLAGIPVREGARLRAPMAPRPAAALENAALPTLADHVDTISKLATEHDHVLVEGAGGLLVELTGAGETLADLAQALPDAAVIVVARSALGTLNHTTLTQEALRSRGIRSIGTVIGSWPSAPTHLELTNRDHLAARPEGLLGFVPEGAPSRGDFSDQAPTWLAGLGQRLGTPCRISP
ncbi:dethiobiotin synthase [Intrasporangium sp. DVR]|uniref:dethiobiotin synthase n=1 Tax=Intrasporangium sp. DVR TaxID=3127867 RepID=UPI00313A6BD1